MTDIAGYAQLATRAADLADRCERAGALVCASFLRDLAREVEETIIQAAPLELPGWLGGRQAGARRPRRVR
jgi:hypothetical protein